MNQLVLPTVPIYYPLPNKCIQASVFCLILFLAGSKVYAQCYHQFSPIQYCEPAPLLCLDQLCMTTQNIPLFGYTNFCGGGTAVHNPQYFLIIPTSETVEIHIMVIQCTSGSGLQSALISQCPWTIDNVITCSNPPQGTPPGGTMILEASGLDPGVPIWLLIDGSSGATCGYFISYVSGIYELDIPGDLSEEMSYASDTLICPGHQDLVLVTSPLDYIHGYYWTVGWSDDVYTTPWNTLTLDVPDDIPDGFWDICVVAYTGCDTSDTEVCITIEVKSKEDAYAEPVTFCLEDFPFTWHNLDIDGPGEFRVSFEDGDGCVYDSVWVIDAYPILDMGQTDTLVCASSYFYEGQIYEISGSYILSYPGQSAFGCDSSAILNLVLGAAGIYVESICSESQWVLTPRVIAQDSLIDTLLYQWHDCAFDSLYSTDASLTITSSGCYCLIVDSGFCIDTICSTYILDPCATECSIVQDTGCLNEAVLFTYDGNIPSGVTLHWLIDLPGQPETYYSGMDSISFAYSDPGCYGASLTLIDSISSFTCHDSICILPPSSTASICCSGYQCGSFATLMIELTGASPWTAVISSEFGIDTITDITNSPYLHTVYPPADSLVEYFLAVTDSLNFCAVLIDGDPSVTIIRYEKPEALITQTVDTLCTVEVPGGQYMWFDCSPMQFLSEGPCLLPQESGCYCVEVMLPSGCADTICYDFIISSTGPLTDYAPALYPVPSKGAWTVRFPSAVSLPVQWILFDLWGRQLEAGSLDLADTVLELKNVPPSGLYLLQFTSPDRKGVSFNKVLIQ